MGSAKSTTLTLSGANQRLLGPNRKRTGIILSHKAANAMFFAFGEDAAVNTGLCIPAGSTPVKLYKDHCGDWIEQAVNVIGTAADVVCCVELSNP